MTICNSVSIRSVTFGNATLHSLRFPISAKRGKPALSGTPPSSLLPRSHHLVRVCWAGASRPRTSSTQL
jgi:hypothetical protein